MAIGAGILFAFDLILWQHSVNEVGAGLATVLANMQVILVALAGWVRLGERPAARVFIGLLVVVGGAVLISGALDRQAYGVDPLLGVVYGLGSAASYAGYLMLVRAANREGRRPFGSLLDASTAAAGTALLAGVVIGDLNLVPSWPAHGWLLIVALTSQVVGYGLINLSLPRLPAVITSLLLMSQPAVTVVLAAGLLHEAPSTIQLGGVGLILVGVAVASGVFERRPSIGGSTQPAV
jgi:drug/metabolite transporter (DMT)-like permease